MASSCIPEKAERCKHAETLALEYRAKGFEDAPRGPSSRHTRIVFVWKREIGRTLLPEILHVEPRSRKDRLVFQFVEEAALAERRDHVDQR